MSKKIVKLAVVREDSGDPCPFGLQIPRGCKVAGNVIDNMAPVTALGEEATQEEKNKIIKANKKLLTINLMQTGEAPAKCKYAANIIANKGAVVCNFDDVAPGVGDVPLLGSPFYSRVMSNVGLNGLYSVPIGNYADYNISRNLYYGIYSIQGNHNFDIIKSAKLEEGSADGAMVAFYNHSDNSVFMMKRSDKVSQPGTWGFPGGHLEKGEFPFEGAIREIEEEMGFIPDLSDIKSYGHLEKDGDRKCIVFIMAVDENVKEKWEDKIKINSEHTEYKWFKTSELPDNLHSVAEYTFKNSANNEE